MARLAAVRLPIQSVAQRARRHSTAAPRAAPPAPSRTHVGPGEREAELLLHRGSEAVAIRVGAVPAGGGATEGVGRTRGAHEGVAVREVFHHERFVRHGEVEAAEIMPVKSGQRGGQVGGRDIELEVAPRGEVRLDARELGQRGVVDDRAERVGDRVADDGERGAGERPGFEVGKREDRIGGHRSLHVLSGRERTRTRKRTRTIMRSYG